MMTTAVRPSRRAKSSATPRPCRRPASVITPRVLACAAIDAAALNHQEKAVFMPVQHLQRLGRHLGDGCSASFRRGRNSCSPARRATTRDLCRRRRGSRGILLDKRRAAAAQIRPHGVRDLLPPPRQDRRTSRLPLPKSGPPAADRRGGSSGAKRRRRRGWQKSTVRHDESRAFPGRRPLEQRRQRLTGPSGFDLDDILRGIGRRIDRTLPACWGMPVM